MVSFKIYDLDDTLCPCGIHYARAKDEYVELIRSALPRISRERALDATNTIGLANTKRMGYSPKRFPTTLRSAYEWLSREEGVEPDPYIAQKMYGIGAGVFAPELYRPFPGVREMLRRYREAGVRIGLCTKGDLRTQRERKILPWGLDGLVDHISIVQQKGADEIAAVADALREREDDVGMMIGDNLREDIAGGAGAGLVTVWIDIDRSGYLPDDSPVDVAPDHVVQSVLEVQEIVPLPRERRRTA